MRILIHVFATGLAFGLVSTAAANEARMQQAVPQSDRAASMSLTVGGDGLEDSYCSDSSSRYVNCDAAFVQACKDAGGTMSGRQGWGGKTCWEPGP